jgi:hypothetical protein
MMDWGTTVVMGLRYGELVCDSGFGAEIWWTGIRQWLWGCDMMDWGTLLLGCDMIDEDTVVLVYNSDIGVWAAA